MNLSLSWEDRRKRWRCSAPLPGGLRKDFYSSETNKKRALKDIEQKYQLYLLEGPKDPTPTLGHVIDAFLEDYHGRVLETTYRKMVSRIKAHLLPLSEQRIQKMKRADWQGILDRAYAGGATSPATLKGIQNAIRAVCKFAAAKGWLEDTAVPLYFLMPKKAKKKGKTILQPEQLKILMNATGNWYLPVFRFIVLTGLRRGELCALQTARDFDGHTITVRESISHDGILTEGKTKLARRVLYLGERALQELKTHQKARQEAGIFCPALFCTPKGLPIPPRALRNEWQKWREKHGIACSVHELRHTHISYAVNRTALPLEDLKQVFGHSEDMNTKAVYVHDIQKSREEKLAELARLRKMAEDIEKALKEDN